MADYLKHTSERPDGCWCYGTGGEYPLYHPVLQYCVGYRRYCTCDDGKRLQAEVEEGAAVAMRHHMAKRIQRVWAKCGVPTAMEGWRYETSPLLAAAARLRELPLTSNVYLHGQTGTGKTGLAVARLRHHLEQTLDDVVYVSSPSLLSRLRHTYGNREESEWIVIRQLQSAGLIVIDDLGAESAQMEWMCDRLYQIIGGRYDEGRPTVVTSNLGLDELREKVGDRLVWRLVDGCERGALMHLAGRNLREVKSSG